MGAEETNQINSTNVSNLPETAHEAALAAYHSFLIYTSDELPEVQSKVDDLMRAGSMFIGDLDLDAEFFADKARALVFVAAADLYNNRDEEETGHTAEAKFNFAINTANLLSEAYKHDRNGSDKQYAESGARLEAAYERFRHNELTAELQSAIDGGSLERLGRRLGVETPIVKALVLDMGHKGAAPLPRYRENDNEREAELLARRNEFAQLSGYTRPTYAWADSELGTIVLPRKVAEAFLHPELFQDPEQAQLESREIIWHESTHLIGESLVLANGSLGVVLEELRAEYYSGGSGYVLEKLFSVSLGAITGKKLQEYFNDLPAGGDAHTVYTRIAHDLGLASMLEIVSLLPRNSDIGFSAKSPVPGAEAYLELSGVSSRIFERLIAMGRTREVAENIQKAAGELLNAAGGNYDRAWKLAALMRDKGDQLAAGFVRQQLINMQAEQNT